MQTSRVRPTGITILAVLEAIGSGLLVLGGLALAVLGPFVAEFIPRPIPGLMTGALVAFIGVVMLILGLAGFVIAWGLWTGQGWAWSLALVFAIIGVILALFQLPGGIISLLINGLIAYYLWQPRVKAFYRKEAVELPYQVTVTRAPTQPAQPQPGTAIYCAKCGTANPLDSRFCRNCGAEIKA